jgi:hypothetical protein
MPLKKATEFLLAKQAKQDAYIPKELKTTVLKLGKQLRDMLLVCAPDHPFITEFAPWDAETEPVAVIVGHPASSASGGLYLTCVIKLLAERIFNIFKNELGGGHVLKDSKAYDCVILPGCVAGMYRDSAEVC